jgi:uncharacterized protein YndB with AHSA1/START domain
MPHIENSVSVARSPEEVWTVLGDMPNVDRWAPGIAAVRMEGMTRICTLPDGMGEIHETLAVSERDRSFNYEQTQHPLPLALSRGTLAVAPADAGAIVSWRAEIEFADPALEDQFLPMLRQGYAAALENLKTLMETPATSSA